MMIMRYCTNCGAELEEYARFCPICGATIGATPAPDYSAERELAEEKEFLDATCRFLKYERIAWKVLGIIMLVLGCIYSVLALIMAFGFMADSDAAAAAVALFIAASIFLAPAIIGLIKASRIGRYMENIYDDPISALNCTGSVGSIVLAAFFNEIALIFVIINFARTKSNDKIVERIKSRYGYTA